MKNFAKYLGIELRLNFRIPIQVFFIFVFPIFLMFAFASGFGSSDPHYIPQNIALIMFYSVLSASIASLSVSISRYRQDNFYYLLERRAGSKTAYLLAQVTSYLLVIFVATLASLLVAHLAYAYSLPSLSALALFYLKLYLYALPFFALAVIIGLSVPNSAAASAVSLPLMFVCFFFAGMMVPYSLFTGSLKTIADHFFLTGLLSDLTHTLTGGSYLLTPNWWLIGGSVALIAALTAVVLKRSSLVRR